MTKEIMTTWYRAPEVILGNYRYGPELDMWSVGTIIYEMLTGAPMFASESEIAVLLKIMRLKGTASLNIDGASEK